MNNQDFREIRNSLGVDQFLLPVGLRGQDGAVHRVVTMKPMTGRTEEILADPKLKENPMRAIIDVLVDVIVSIDGIPRVTRDVLRQLNNKDLEFLLVANHITSFDDEYTFISKHPVDGAENEVIVNLKDLLDTANYIDDSESTEMTFELPRGYRDREGNLHKEITVVVPTAFIQEQVYKQTKVNPASAITKMLLLCTKKLGTMTMLNPDVFKDMTKKDRDFILRKINEFDGGVDLNVEVVCSSCGDTYKDAIPAVGLLGEM